jgi:predicted Rossmann-fold nucleotide-binding protein
MVIVVCGGRDFNDEPFIREALDLANNQLQIEVLIHGNCEGVDKLSGKWARDNGVQEVIVPPNWKLHGKAAGPIRNSVMLDLNADVLVAFPGGSGTDNITNQANKKRIKVITIKRKSNENK